MSGQIIEVAVIKALYRYPVKSMQGEELEEGFIWWHGLEGDRKYAFVQSNNRSGFPWLTGRQIPQMVRYMPYFTDLHHPLDGSVRVKTPSGEDLLLESEALHQELAQQYGQPFHLMKLSRGAVDSMSLSLIGLPSIRFLGESINRPHLDPRRFRPNILLEPLNQEAFTEESWLDHVLIIGDRSDSVRVRANRKNRRCMMINIDPITATQTPAVLRETVRTREEFAGIYASIEKPGTVRVGDVIRLVN